MSESDIDICIEQVQIELEQDMPVRKRQVRMLLSEISRLRAELSTQETLVATLQEQKYAWDELLGENKFLRAELETAKKCIRSMWKNDKTPTYEYYGKNRRTRFGDCPSVGERWKTPREIAESVIGESALYAIKEQA